MGNALSAGNAAAAKLAVNASMAMVPPFWACTFLLLVEPHVQAFVMRVFTDGSDAQLLAHMHRLLWGMAGMLLVDSWQLSLQGFLQVGRMLLAPLMVVTGPLAAHQQQGLQAQRVAYLHCLARQTLSVTASCGGVCNKQKCLYLLRNAMLMYMHVPPQWAACYYFHSFMLMLVEIQAAGVGM